MVCSLLVLFVASAGIFVGIIMPSNRTDSNHGRSGTTGKEKNPPHPAATLAPIEDEKPSAQNSPVKWRAPIDDAALIESAGRVYYKILYLDDNTGYDYGGSEKTPSASVIKVFIMQYIFDEVTDGNITLNDSINGLSIHRLINDMIQKSDNNATNILIDKFGMAAINANIQSRGYKDTVLSRRMLDFNARERGIENYTSLNDAVDFLKTMYDNREIYPYKEMLDIMQGQTIRTKIPLCLPQNTVIANKTGELDAVENDMGIVFSENGDFIIAVFTDNVHNSSETRAAIGLLAKDALSKM